MKGSCFKEGNPAYDRYIHSAAWRKKADERMEMDRHICQVCGKPASDVHHLNYAHFGCEEMSDLVSLCRRCHSKAEEIYSPEYIPWAMEEKKPGGNNFMAAMRADAAAVAPVVFEYLKEAGGISFESMLRLRQPDDAEERKYWNVLKKAVDALCRKRYSLQCVADRTDMMLETTANHIAVICLSQIEHAVRNHVQAQMHETVNVEYAVLQKWKAVAEYLGITDGTLKTIRGDDGTSFGPSLRETVLYYCGLDASAGIRPAEGFECLSPEDYRHLNTLADYMNTVSGSGAFRGEYKKEVQINA